MTPFDRPAGVNDDFSVLDFDGKDIQGTRGRPTDDFSRSIE
jgi:hypothetical protein